LDTARSFVDQAEVVPLSDDLAERAIELRRSHGVPLADSVIGATALHRDATLVTRNIADFDAIPSLDLYNPHDVTTGGSSG
jgi:predicted nucleic acid-binding protein